MMATLALDSKYVDVLKSLGNLEETLEEAVRRYAIAQIGERMAGLQREILSFQNKFGLPYEVFYARVTTDDEFAAGLRDAHPTWERDFNAWEYYVEELSEWLGRLESISKT